MFYPVFNYGFRRQNDANYYIIQYFNNELEEKEVTVDE